MTADNARRGYLDEIEALRRDYEMTYAEARECWAAFYVPRGSTAVGVMAARIRAASGDTHTSTVVLADPEQIQKGRGLICPFCHDGITDYSTTIRCNCCAADYHQDCLQHELRGKCGVYGCGGIGVGIVGSAVTTAITVKSEKSSYYFGDLTRRDLVVLTACAVTATIALIVAIWSTLTPANAAVFVCSSSLIGIGIVRLASYLSATPYGDS